MIDDLESILTTIDNELDKDYNSKSQDEWREKREAATAAALLLCPKYIKEWLIDCTAGADGKAYSYTDDGDDVEWFSVGQNATHYFSFGIRPDGVFIKKTSGPEYHKECQCWYDRTTVRIVTEEDVPKNYWGHL